MVFLIPGVGTISGISPTPPLIRGIVNSGCGGGFFASVGRCAFVLFSFLPWHGSVLVVYKRPRVARSKAPRPYTLGQGCAREPHSPGAKTQRSPGPALLLIPGILNSGCGNDFRKLHFDFNSGN